MSDADFANFLFWWWFCLVIMPGCLVGMLFISPGIIMIIGGLKAARRKAKGERR